VRERERGWEQIRDEMEKKRRRGTKRKRRERERETVVVWCCNPEKEWQKAATAPRPSPPHSSTQLINE